LFGSLTESLLVFFSAAMAGKGPVLKCFSERLVPEKLH
jgi:hypothetical protein